MTFSRASAVHTWIASLMIGSIVLPASSGHGEDRAAAPACAPDPALVGTVAAVTDGRTFVLTDGREVRLAAIETPGSRHPAPQRAPSPSDRGADGQAAADAAALAALSALVSGREIALTRLTPATDRYRRVLARAFVVRDGMPRSVEIELVAQGRVFVAPRGGGEPCTTGLFTAERTARAGKLGLWGDPYYEIKQAENPVAVLAERGRFAIVEGKVVSVRESGGTVYVNFGKRWSEDFTVTILKRNLRRFTSAGIEPKTLAGRRVRVRGWIEERGGPWIEAAIPEQIEIAEDH